VKHKTNREIGIPLVRGRQCALRVQTCLRGMKCGVTGVRREGARQFEFGVLMKSRTFRALTVMLPNQLETFENSTASNLKRRVTRVATDCENFEIGSIVSAVSCPKNQGRSCSHCLWLLKCSGIQGGIATQEGALRVVDFFYQT
jgi:hypothetical protein